MNEQANAIIRVCSRFCHLKLVKIHVNSILDELSDGFNLISLVEILSGKQVNNGRYKQSATSRFQRADNINILLNYIIPLIFYFIFMNPDNFKSDKSFLL